MNAWSIHMNGPLIVNELFTHMNGPFIVNGYTGDPTVGIPYIRIPYIVEPNTGNPYILGVKMSLFLDNEWMESRN